MSVKRTEQPTLCTHIHSSARFDGEGMVSSEAMPYRGLLSRTDLVGRRYSAFVSSGERNLLTAPSVGSM